jgi:hypothetical protein
MSNHLNKIKKICTNASYEDRIEIDATLINAKSVKKANSLLAKPLPKKLDSQFDNLKVEISKSTDYAKIWFCNIILYILKGKGEIPNYLPEDWEHAADFDQACFNLLNK